MTSSESKHAGGPPSKVQKGTGSEVVTRKASFKTANRPRRAPPPTSTVQALTSKFNELSQANQTQIGRIGQKHKMARVICRKPSASKYKRTDFQPVMRKRVPVRKIEEETYKMQNFRLNVNQINETQRNVLQKVTELEGRTIKPVPKVLVDIDLNDDKCLKAAQVPKENQRNSLSVRTAINIFEKGTGDVRPVSKPAESKEVKAKPIATIKPILKKPEPVGKTKLSPTDSLNRKKYVAMKRDPFKSNGENKQERTVEVKPPDGIKIFGKENEVQNEKNYSSLFGQISQSKVSAATGQNSTKRRQFAKLLKNEELKDEERKDMKEVNEVRKEPEPETGNQNHGRKPNMSFLWSKKEEATEPAMEKKTSRMDMPLPLPPENFVPDVDLLYDDVRAVEDDFDKTSTHSDETVYDDIGHYDQSNEGYEKIYNPEQGIKSNESHRYDRINAEVLKLNKLNEMANGVSSDSLYCISDKLPYSYDDGEGEGYQYIRTEMPKTVKVVTKDDESETYQYNNIYEDIKSVQNRMLKERGVYEDVNSMTDNLSISNCYESVYNGVYTNNQVYVRSNVSDTSNNSGRSTYEKSNSLYGIPAGVDGSRGSPTDGNESSDTAGYQITSYGTARPDSETSQSNSDEWVEVSESESEHERKQERTRKPRSGNAGWSQKVRRRWSKLQKKSYVESIDDDSKGGNSDDHLYESIGQYEDGDFGHEEADKAVQAEQSYNLNDQPIYCDEQCIDDFDSEISGDENNINSKLPDVPHNSYNITRSLKAAGKRLRKNFSLRKSDLSKSLKRFKRPSRSKIDDQTFAAAETEANTSLCSDGSAANSDPSVSPYLNNSDSSSSSHTYSKNKSLGDIKAHQKTWTFRNKFKRNSTSEEIENSDLKSSTFYLSLSEVQPQGADLLSEIQNRISQRTAGSTENVSEVANKNSMRRQSQPNENRLSMAKVRPSVPPPPPPSNGTEATKYSDVIVRRDRTSGNSLYAECGLFDKQKKRSRCPSDSSTSWYTEVGLYSANENSSHVKKSQMFVDEPLYQFYTECVNQQARDDILKNYDSEGYEEINDYYTIINEKRRTLDIKNVRPNFEDFNDDAPPKVSPFRTQARTLWCQIPGVIDSCILETLTDHQKKLQEAKFEILMSEGSYMNSLNVLENHFMKKIKELNIIPKRDFKILFGNILSVKKCSESFLNDLEDCWQNDIMLSGICDIVHRHANNDFNVYVKYCKNQVCIYRTLRELIDKNLKIESALKEIENDSVCQNLSIHSFLMLPMQRITRLPLLLGAVLARLNKSDDEFEICKASFEALNKIVQECDDEARKMEKCEEMLILSQQMEFPKEIRVIPIITGTRFLVKSGQVTQLVNRDENKLTFGKKFTKVNLTLFLFTDLLIVTKKKSARNYVVVDHCPRNLIQLQTTEGLSQLPCKLSASSDMGGKNLMLLTMLENHEKKTVEMILSLEMESDRQRWLEAVTPKLSQNPDESIYEEWDCPQVIAIYEFTSAQPDELSLCIGDVVNVLKKISDGWYQGERLRDGARGWFPENHTQEISSSHVRAKNKKQRYRFLALSRNFIESQMKNGK